MQKKCLAAILPMLIEHALGMGRMCIVSAAIVHTLRYTKAPHFSILQSMSPSACCGLGINPRFVRKFKHKAVEAAIMYTSKVHCLIHQKIENMIIKKCSEKPQNKKKTFGE
jgi:hypothetical protein